MWNHAISFSTPIITRTPSGIKQTTEQWGEPIRASFKDLTRDDETLANQLGYTADQAVEIHRSNYSGQAYFRDEETGDVYDIKRTFNGDGKMTVNLICSLRERGKVVGHG